MVEYHPVTKYEFNPISGEDDDILNSPSPRYMFGLTRKERALKNLLFEAWN
ncbi:DUF3603 family protein [Bacillus sp. EB01]|uniref:DUF3603 family protein n=1 Tax=Bacillus sp. EB01 TaxID=1347086 RepID=UPI0009DE91B8